MIGLLSADAREDLGTRLWGLHAHFEEDWDNYFNSDIRKENERKFAEILARETRYEIFRMGFLFG